MRNPSGEPVVVGAADARNRVYSYEILLLETDPSLVKFEAICGWMKVAGKDPIDYLTRHGDRFAMLYIKDLENITKPVTTLMSFMSPDMPTPTELGRIDLKPIVEAGLRAGGSICL